MSEHSDQQEIINKLKEVAIELGHTPTLNQFMKYVSDHKIRTRFGSYTVLVQAAGLDLKSRFHGPKIHPNSIFDKNLEEVLVQYKPRDVAPVVHKYAPTLFIGDTHFPFINNKVLEKIYRFAEKEQPLRIIQVGDLYDLYAHSKFPRSQNGYSPRQEEELGRKGAEDMWKTLRSLCPRAECVQIKGNHDIRPVKRTLELQPAVEHIIEKHVDSLMTFDGVKLIADHREEYKFDDVAVLHGHKSQLGAHRDYMLMNNVHGHTHKGGVLFRKLHDRILWEMDCGFVGDIESKALSYTPQKMTNEITGLGWLDEYGPRFIAIP